MIVFANELYFRTPEEIAQQELEELRRREELVQKLEQERIKKLTKKKKINL